MSFFNTYILELIFRFSYVLFSYLICWLILINFTEILFLFEIYPLVHNLTNKRFILTQITQLFNTIWFLVSFFSILFIYPLVSFQFLSFFTSGWYVYQFNFFKKVINFSYFFFFFIYIFTHIFIISSFLSFFLYWEIQDEHSLLRIEAEISLYYYIIWISSLKFFLSALGQFFLSFLYVITHINNVNFLYFIVYTNKKIFISFFVFTLLVIIPPDFVLQLLITTIIIIIVELSFFFICVKYSIKNAYIKTIIKKTS